VEGVVEVRLREHFQPLHVPFLHQFANHFGVFFLNLALMLPDSLVGQQQYRQSCFTFAIRLV